MDIESYFEFLSDEDIRIKGTRIGIETVLDDYFDGASPEEIAARYNSLALEQVYATITYYLSNRVKVDSYLDAWRQHAEQSIYNQEHNPPDVVRRLRRLKAVQNTSNRSMAS